MTPTDEELLAAYRSGDAEAFEELYRRHSGKVYAYLARRLGPHEQPDEVFQKFFLKLHQCRAQYAPPRPALPWMFTVLRTTLVDHVRGLARQGRALAELGDIALASGPGEAAEPLEERLAGLDERQRRALRWRFFEDWSYERIAGALGSSQQNARQLVSRALKRLRGER